MEAIPVLAILGPNFKHCETWRHQDLKELQILLFC